jgi:hypothetical protein
MRTICFLVLSLFFVGCTRSGDFMTKYHEDGRAKPIAMIAPMIDTTSFDAPWSLSEEFTSTISSQLGQNGKIYVSTQSDEPISMNPFSSDLSWIRREFSGQEFVVFLELVEHEVVPVKLRKEALPQESSSNLNIGLRLRVVDIRSQPKIVLQEIIREGYFIPKTLIPTDYSVVTWGSSEYSKTPMGLAHAQIIREVVTRIGDYILLAKSR